MKENPPKIIKNPNEMSIEEIQEESNSLSQFTGNPIKSFENRKRITELRKALEKKLREKNINESKNPSATDEQFSNNTDTQDFIPFTEEELKTTTTEDLKKRGYDILSDEFRSAIKRENDILSDEFRSAIKRENDILEEKILQNDIDFYSTYDEKIKEILIEITKKEEQIKDLDERKVKEIEELKNLSLSKNEKSQKLKIIDQTYGGFRKIYSKDKDDLEKKLDETKKQVISEYNKNRKAETEVKEIENPLDTKEDIKEEEENDEKSNDEPIKKTYRAGDTVSFEIKDEKENEIENDNENEEDINQEELLKKRLEILEQQYLEWKKSHDEILEEYENILENENTTYEEEPLNVSVSEIINANTEEAGRENLPEEMQNKSKEEVEQIIEEEIVSDINNKNTESTSSKKENSILKWIKRKTRRALVGLLLVGNFASITSFRFKPSDETLAYDKIEVDNLKDWDSVKLYEDEINKLDNISIINESRENTKGKYLIIDKEVGHAHLYENGDLISTYEVGTGENKGDEQTKTMMKDGKVYWEQGNKQTGAGIYTINKKYNYENSPSFTLCNERGIEVPTVLHKTSRQRAKFFDDGDINDNRMTKGCINFKASSMEQLSKEEGFGPGVKVYVLPDNPHNKFILKNGELRFISNEKNVNKTIRPYSPQSIVLKAENINEDGKEFLQTLAKNKQEILKLYPGVSNEVYNELAKIAYGIFGQESSFGTYGAVRGQVGRVEDKIGAVLNKNVSAGVTQIRISSINPKIKEAFDINKTSDLFDISKSSVATLSHLIDIYINNIPNRKKDEYIKLAILHYNNPKEFRNVIKNNTKKIQNRYVDSVLKYSKDVKVYISDK